MVGMPRGGIGEILSNRREYVGGVEERITWRRTALPICLRMSNGKSSITRISPAQVWMMNCLHLRLMRDVIIHFANRSCMVPGSEENSNGEGRSLLGNGQWCKTYILFNCAYTFF